MHHLTTLFSNCTFNIRIYATLVIFDCVPNNDTIVVWTDEKKRIFLVLLRSVGLKNYLYGMLHGRVCGMVTVDLCKDLNYIGRPKIAHT